VCSYKDGLSSRVIAFMYSNARSSARTIVGKLLGLGGAMLSLFKNRYAVSSISRVDIDAPPVLRPSWALWSIVGISQGTLFSKPPT
jgi:hypothetical protein